MAVKAKTQTTVVNVNDGYAGVNWIKDSAYELIVTKDTTLPQNQPYIYIQINAESDIFDLQTIVNKTCTFSLYVYSPGESVIVDPDEPDVVKTRFGAHMITYWLDSDGNQKSTYPFSKLVTYSEKNKGRISSAQEISPPDSTHTILKKLTVAIQAGLKPASDNDETWVIAYPKFEIGDTATEWSPCPTDSISVEKRVTSAETSIKNNTTQINLRATKTEVATAKSEAISTAASDATTKANNAKSEAIAESKTYTDAQIKVESDSITSTVEKTYATKLALDSTDKTVSSHTSSISTLQQTAEGFEARITSNKTAAAKAQTTADSASTSAAAAQTAATNAQTAATTAQSTADTAKSNAATAQTTADDAKSAAAAAQSTADTAKTNAATAQTTAEAAKSTADSASASAATAQTAAEGAQSTADTAVTNAATAQSTANTARTEASDAAKTATNYLKFSEDTGLLVGDMTTDTVGYNTQIMSDGIKIRNGSTTLAEYGETITIGDSSSFNTHVTDSAFEIRDGTKILASYQGDTILLGSDSAAQINLLNGEGIMCVDESSDWFNIESTKRYCVVRSEMGSFLLSAVYDNDDRSNNRRASVCARAHESLDLTAYMEVQQGVSSGKSASVKLYEDNILIDSHIGYTGGNVNTYTDRTYISLRYDNGIEFYSTKDIYMNVSGESFKPYYAAGDSITTANMRLNGFITNSGSQLYFSIPLCKPIVGATKATITNHASKSLIIRQAGEYVWGSDGSTWINPTSWSVSLEEGMINVTATSSSKTYKNNYPAAILFRGTITFS